MLILGEYGETMQHFPNTSGDSHVTTGLSHVTHMWQGLDLLDNALQTLHPAHPLTEVVPVVTTITPEAHLLCTGEKT